MSLSAVIVVRDEAEHLDACLASLRGLTDEIVVVDTGSTDRSVAVAERHGAVVARGPVARETGPADVARARNHGLELATGDWILSVDADERVRGDFDAVRAHLDGVDGRVGFRVCAVPRAGWTPVRELRLWRNRGHVRFDGPTGERVVPAITAAADGLRIDPFDLLTVHRLGDDDNQAASRARDEPMLTAELRLHPDRTSVYDRLARLYEAAGDGDRAVDLWKEGIAVVRNRAGSEPEDRALYAHLVHHLLTRGMIDDELAVLVQEARGAFDRTPTLELAAARLAFATGRPRDALEPLTWLVELDDEAIIETGSSYDARVFGEWAWSLIGLCRFALGDDAAAADAFARAEDYAPGDESYAVRRRLAEARAGDAG